MIAAKGQGVRETFRQAWHAAENQTKPIPQPYSEQVEVAVQDIKKNLSEKKFPVSRRAIAIKLLEGDPATCLKEPKTILLSESKVDQYFPEGNPMGKSIAMNSESELYRVTGIVEDAPRTSHFNYEFIASYTSDGRSDNTFWFNNWMMTYFLATPGTDPFKQVSFSIQDHKAMASGLGNPEQAAIR